MSVTSGRSSAVSASSDGGRGTFLFSRHHDFLCIVYLWMASMYIMTCSRLVGYQDLARMRLVGSSLPMRQHQVHFMLQDIVSDLMPQRALTSGSALSPEKTMLLPNRTKPQCMNANESLLLIIHHPDLTPSSSAKSEERHTAFGISRTPVA